MAILQLCNDPIVQPIGRPQSEFLGGIVQHIDRTGFGSGELGCLGNDGGQDGFEVDARIHRLSNLLEGAQLLDRPGEFARARLR